MLSLTTFLLYLLASMGWRDLATSNGLLTAWILPMATLVAMAVLGSHDKMAKHNGFSDDWKWIWGWWPITTFALLVLLTVFKYDYEVILQSALKFGDNAAGVITEALYLSMWLYAIIGFLFSLKEILHRILAPEFK
jgi:hypothetical protein